MIKVSFKTLKSGMFSTYLDIYYKTSDNKSKRSYEFLGIHVHKDYSSPRVWIIDKDSENMKLVQAIRNTRETVLNFAKHGYEKPNKRVLDLYSHKSFYGSFS